jgi:hypothetical protein
MICTFECTFLCWLPQHVPDEHARLWLRTVRRPVPQKAMLAKYSGFNEARPEA